MRYLCYYFGQHHEYKKAVFLLGKGRGLDELNALLETSLFDELKLVLEDELDQAKQGIDLLPKKEFVANLGKYSSYAFIVDGYEDQRALFSFAKAKPTALVGIFDKDYDSFALFEAYREACDTIAIARYVNPLRNEVLEWKRGEFEKELSIIFPVYNVGAYLRQCVESVTAFDAPYVEFLFVSDGSKDDSVEILREYAAKDPRIQIFEKENGGCASARQYGLERAKGRYIGFVDPDDFVDPTMFRKLLSRAFAGSYDIAYSGYKEYYEDSGESQDIDDLIGAPYEHGTSDVDLVDDLIAFRRIAIWRGIYSHNLLTNNGIIFHPELPRFDDLPFKVETLARAKSVVSVPEYLYYYRLGRKGQDVAADDRRLYVHFDIFRMLDAFFASPRSSRQKDLYRIVKTQTHAWALTRIKSYWKKDYRAIAAEDLGIKDTKRSWAKAIRSYGGRKGVKENRRAFNDDHMPISNRLLSVIIPCDKYQTELKELLDRLANAPFLRFEALVVDYGSESEELRSLCAQDSRFRYVALPSGNEAKAKNVGLEKAKGDYVWFLKMGDTIPEQGFAALEEAFAQEKRDIFAFDYHVLSQGKETNIKAEEYGENEYLLVYLRDGLDHPGCANKLYSRRFLLGHGLRFDESVCPNEDVALNYLAFKSVSSVSTIHRVLCIRPCGEEESNAVEALVALSEKDNLDSETKAALVFAARKNCDESLLQRLEEAGWLEKEE